MKRHDARNNFALSLRQYYPDQVSGFAKMDSLPVGIFSANAIFCTAPHE